MYFSTEGLLHIPNPLPPESDTVLPWVVASTTSLYALALGTYILRIWFRTREEFILGWDDLFITLAMAVGTAQWGLNITMVVTTGGKHIWYLDMSRYSAMGKYGFIYSFPWFWAVTCVKVSLCFMLLRIKGQSKPWFIGLWMMIAFLICFAFGLTIVFCVMCDPIEANWNLKYLADTTACWPISTFVTLNYVYGVVFAVTDLICALLPIAFIHKINRPMREKVTLSLLMSLGMLATLGGVMKMVNVKPTLYSNDPFWNGAKPQVWAIVETCIGITAANIPCLKMLIDKFFLAVGLRTTTAGSSSKRTRHSSMLDDTELGNVQRFSNHNKDVSYHNAIRGMAHKKDKDDGTSTDEQNLIDSVTMSSGARKSIDGFNKCYVTKEYEISWSKGKTDQSSGD